MPKMNGYDFYDKIKDKDNKVKSCFISAFETGYKALSIFQLWKLSVMLNHLR